MFGKFSKKKSEESISEIKSKQKNDLFTLLEESPEKNSISAKAQSNNNPKVNTKPKATSNPKPEATSNPKPEATSNPKPEATSNPKPEATSNPKTELISKTTLKPDNDSKSRISTMSFSGQNIPESSVKGDKSQLLLLEVEKLHDKTIKPVVDFNENCLFYPILSKIGQSPDDISFLDELANEGTMIKEVFEKLMICPVHPNAFSSSVRLYCPKCNSLNVEKLNLYEHKRCGFITENAEYDFSDPKNSTCPSCKKNIVDFKKEIRIPAAWHQCKDCNEKFDNAIVKLYCRQHEHDFDINASQFVTTYSYRLKDFDAPITSDDDKMHEDLIALLNKFNFTTEFKASIKGKSGNAHKVPIYAKNNSNGETMAIFINRQVGKVSQVDINSILIPILDLGPKNTLLLSTTESEDGVEVMAKQYGIKIISDSDLSKIIHHVDEFVSENYSRNGEK